MAFGWSVGDVIAGIKVVHDVYQAISDGPINAQRGMPLFFTSLPESDLLHYSSSD